MPHVPPAVGLGLRRLNGPHIVGGVIIAVAAAAYFALRRSTKTRTSSERPAAHTSPMMRMVDGLSAVAVPKRSSPLSQVEIPQLARAANAPVASEDSSPQRNWFSHHLELLKAAVKAWSDDYAPSMGAALSYYTLFSIAPLLIVVIAVAGMVFGQDAAQGAIVGQLRGMMGEEGAVAVEGMLKAAREPAKSMIATVAGIATLLLGSTAIFGDSKATWTASGACRRRAGNPEYGTFCAIASFLSDLCSPWAFC